MQTAGGTAGAAAAAAVIGVAGITVPLAMSGTLGGPEYHQAAAPLPPAELRFPRFPSPRALGLDRERVAKPAAALTQDETGDAEPAPDAPSGSESQGGSTDSGKDGGDSGEDGGGANLDQEPAEEDPGDDSGGGGSEDPNLIRFVVETVQETVEDLPPLPNP
jgi:hypothetical protein